MRPEVSTGKKSKVFSTTGSENAKCLKKFSAQNMFLSYTLTLHCPHESFEEFTSRELVSTQEKAI